MLSDPGAEVAARFGVAIPLSAELRAAHETLGLDLAEFNASDDDADDPWILPAPSRFVIASDRTVVAARVSRDIAARPDASDIVGMIDPALVRD